MNYRAAFSLLLFPGSMLLSGQTAVATTPTNNVCAGYDYGTMLTVARSSDKLTVEALFKVGGLNPCSFYSEVELRSPSGRTQSGVSASGGAFEPQLAISAASMSVLYDTGTYSATGRWAVENDVQGLPWTYYRGETGWANKNATATVNGFVQLTGVEWNPTSIPRNAGASFWVYFVSSTGCTGDVAVTSTIGAIPVGSTWAWGSVANPVVVTTASATSGSVGTQGRVQFPLVVSSPYTGTVTASAGLWTVPYGCESRGPAVSSAATATLTLTN